MSVSVSRPLSPLTHSGLDRQVSTPPISSSQDHPLGGHHEDTAALHQLPFGTHLCSRPYEESQKRGKRVEKRTICCRHSAVHSHIQTDRQQKRVSSPEGITYGQPVWTQTRRPAPRRTRTHTHTQISTRTQVCPMEGHPFPVTLPGAAAHHISHHKNDVRPIEEQADRRKLSAAKAKKESHCCDEFVLCF